MNQAFIDGQNLYLGTTNSKKAWKVDLCKFRVYLEKKYKVSEAYYYLGCIDDRNTEMYNQIQRAGFILVFREHRSDLLSHKKGNVDTDIVFSVMKKLYLREKFDKEVDVIEKTEIDKNSRIEKEIEKTGVIVYER